MQSPADNETNIEEPGHFKKCRNTLFSVLLA